MLSKRTDTSSTEVERWEARMSIGLVKFVTVVPGS